MRTLSLALMFGLCWSCALGQWNTSNNHIYNTNSGNVGIGTTNPSYKLHLYSTTAVDRVAIQGSLSNSNVGFMIMNQDGSQRWSIASVYNQTYLQFWRSGYGNVMVLQDNGNVGIGTTNPDAKLTVKGTIHSEEVKVDLNVPAPDYVFEETYNLSSLSEVASYIRSNKHLPEIPSAQEMEENGVNLGEMNMLLLRKIEELTLYLIEQNKVIDQLKACNDSPDPSGKKVEELTLYLLEQNKSGEEYQKMINLLIDENKKQQEQIDELKEKIN